MEKTHGRLIQVTSFAEGRREAETRLRSPGIRLNNLCLLSVRRFWESKQSAPMIRTYAQISIRLQTCFTSHALMICPPPSSSPTPSLFYPLGRGKTPPRRDIRI